MEAQAKTNAEMLIEDLATQVRAMTGVIARMSTALERIKEAASERMDVVDNDEGGVGPDDWMKVCTLAAVGLGEEGF